MSGEQWKAVYEALNGSGVQSVDGKVNKVLVLKIKDAKSEKGKVERRKSAPKIIAEKKWNE